MSEPAVTVPCADATDVQARAALATAQGFVGSRTDDTPAAHYSVAGVNARLAVPSAHDRAAVSLRELQS